MSGVYAKDGSYNVTIVGGDSGSSAVEVTNFPTTQDVSGTVLDNILSELEAQTVLLQTIADNTGV